MIASDAQPIIVRQASSEEPRDTAAGQTTPAHDKCMAAAFLAALDPNADGFTFQLFGDGPDKHADVLHGTLDQVWPKVLAVNTPNHRVGVFVTINETDFKGRRTENIVRPRAHFADADTAEQIAQCIERIKASGATPSMIVKSGKGLHFYWLCSDIPRDQFSALQKALFNELGTDKAVHDLPRVMRLPGTLHLKDPTKPRLVALCNPSSPARRWSCSELMAKLGPSAEQSASNNNVAGLRTPEWAFRGRPTAAFDALSPDDSLSAGLEADIEEVRSAVAAIPPSAILTEPEWMKLAYALAHQAAFFPKQTEKLWEILDTASRRAPGYNEEDNRNRFNRYINEALNHPNPVTIATVFHLASEHGWQGCLPSQRSNAFGSGGGPSGAANTTGPTNSTGPSGSTGPNVPPSRAVHLSNLPLIPPKRRWLHGTDLIRGAVTVLVAPGGRAKSTWLLACALACASGRDLLDSHVFGGPLRVLCVSTEDGMLELALRLRAAQKLYELTDADVPALFIIGADRWGFSLLQGDRYRAIIDQRGMAALTAELDYIRPDVLIIDPLINVMGGVSSNDNAAAALLMSQLVGLATMQHMAVALAHHTSKGRDPASAESAMGAASFINLARIVLAIEPLDPKDAGTIGLPPWEARSIFRVLGTKQNFTPPNLNDRWFRVVSVPMPNAEPPIYLTGDQVAVVAPFQPGVSGPSFPNALLRDALLVIQGASPPLTPSKRSRERYAAPIIADVIKNHRAGQASELDGKAVLDHLMNAGLVSVQDVKVLRSGKGADTRKGLVLTAAGELVLQNWGQAAATTQNPQCPQSPATALGEEAGGDPLGPPQRQGGVGEMRGDANKVDARLPARSIVEEIEVAERNAVDAIKRLVAPREFPDG